MHARSALFDLYGDHLVRREGWAPVAGLVRILDALDIAAPAVRTAVSRMVREGWLRPIERAGARGYATTDQARSHLQGAHDRIYDTRPRGWDGKWDVVVLQPIATRAVRDRVTALLRYLGYANLSGTTWLAAHRHDELELGLHAVGVDWHGFASRLDGDDRELAMSLWDLEDLAQSYRRFTRELLAVGPASDPSAPDEDDRAAFAQRADLVHRWRLFLFTDPSLPADVLPADWPRPQAATAFCSAAQELAAPADAYVDECLSLRRPQSASTMTTAAMIMSTKVAVGITAGRRTAG
ncbi:MAG: PaaX family transcriptional regulator C-terminal domain-containing protein [Micrococcales bacterium]|nr:PaaX family transcriptional regulator C-terminal domain-containing protein [Micrococcales bacterium]